MVAGLSENVRRRRRIGSDARHPALLPGDAGRRGVATHFGGHLHRRDVVFPGWNRRGLAQVDRTARAITAAPTRAAVARASLEHQQARARRGDRMIAETQTPLSLEDEYNVNHCIVFMQEVIVE